ncbi:large ribosomal subunit protein uL22m [Petromyzon marinus]|uniref:Large ribosomal subunit protein uL22m n=1 Tax=Petromyzon marinus TaxID=7757 RepID=A0AAJ7XEF6_PETMA|nr:39S ribosomal protein L22, mitochondrial [Petromyzon marinus]XP_061416422.1 large ribosomal subunit protein uL22m [Lethenteron reissneri]
MALPIRRGLDALARLATASGVLTSPWRCLHVGAVLSRRRNWEPLNRVVYPPQQPGEERRPAEIFHCHRQIKYSKDKMWYLATLIKGLSVDEALAQLEFSDKKGAKVMKEVLLEAQEMAVNHHNVEFRSNLYVAESFVGKGMYLKRLRYHGRGMFGIMDKVRCHYFVKLVEGPPPSAAELQRARYPVEHARSPLAHLRSPIEQARLYVKELRQRTVPHSL